MRYGRGYVTLTGHIDVPIVMQWNTFDPTIPTRFHGVYPAQVKAAGAGKWLTVLHPVGEGHCNFTDDQTATALMPSEGGPLHGLIDDTGIPGLGAILTEDYIALTRVFARLHAAFGLARVD